MKVARRPVSLTADMAVALFFIVLGLVLLFVWIPLDIESGVLERHRRRVNIGDAMAPTMVAIGFLLCGVYLFAISWWRGNRSAQDFGLTRDNFRYLIVMATILTVSLALMRWLGPVVVSLIGTADIAFGTYRELRDTAPWKYIGFAAGGFVLIISTIGFIEHRLTWRGALVAMLATAILAALYDLPFDDLVLPPNGDV